MRARDFSRTSEASTGPVANNAKPITGRSPSGRPIEVEILPERAANGGVGEVAATPNGPSPGADTPREANPPITIDGIVGEIVGKPVRAGGFLAPLEGRLTAMARDMKRLEWRQEAQKIIDDRLVAELKHRVLLSAGLAELTPEERQNMDAIEVEMRRRIVAQGRGSEEVMAQRLREQGIELDDVVEQIKYSAIVKLIEDRRIKPIIQVSRRDLEMYYEQHHDDYNKPPIYVFRRVSVDNRDPRAAESIATRLAAGEAFPAVASSEFNTYNASEAGRFQIEFEGPQDEGVFSKTAQLNDAARKLTVGQWTGPIEVEGRKHWLFLEKIEDRRRSFKSAQTDIEDLLKNQRTNEETMKFVQRLIDKSSYTSLELMSERLLNVAEKRVLGPVRPGEDVGRPPSRRPMPARSEE